MFDLTAQLDCQRKAKLRAAITVAAQMIVDCPDPQRQWRAMHELRKLQQQLKYPVL